MPTPFIAERPNLTWGRELVFTGKPRPYCKWVGPQRSPILGVLFYLFRGIAAFYIIPPTPAGHPVKATKAKTFTS